MKEYLDTQSMADCTTFMDDSLNSLCKFSDAFNVSPFIPVVVGMAITHHSLLTSLRVNMSHFPLKIFLLPLTSNAMVASGQMAQLSYMARQSVTIWEGQAQSKPIPRTGTGEIDPTLESDHGLNAGLYPQKLKLDKAGLMSSKKKSIGGPVIQDSYTTHVSTGPSMRRHSTSATSTIPSKETQHS